MPSAKVVRSIVLLTLPMPPSLTEAQYPAAPLVALESRCRSWLVAQLL